MPRSRSYSEADLRRAIAEADSYADALKALGLRAAGGNYKTLKKLISELGISIEHFDPDGARRRLSTGRRLTPLEDVLVEHSTYQRASLKRRLYDAGLKERRCELCGLGELWHGKRISLILDHINGVFDDNRLENLRIVCPNCNAGLETHCGRINANGPRPCLRCQVEFRPRTSTQKYCSTSCGSRYPRSTGPRPATRKVERPSHSDLLRELEESNFSAVARNYGVSDNAVRKWVRAYEYQERRAQRAQDG